MSDVHRLALRLAAALEKNGDVAQVLEEHVEGKGDRKLSQVATDVKGGLSLAEALQRHHTLPAPYLAAFAAGDPGLVRELARAARLVTRFRDRLRGAFLAALGMLTMLVLALTVGVNFALPALIQWEETFVAGPREAWRTSAEVLLAVFGPVGLAVIALALVAAFWASSKAGWGMLGGLVTARAAALRSLHALLQRSVPLGEALSLAARIADHPWLSRGMDRAARLLDSGKPLGEALGVARLVPGGLKPMWALGEEPSVSEDGGEEQLSRVAGGLAGVMEAEARGLGPVAGRWVWAAYALIGGALTFWFALTLLSAWIEVNEWPT